MTAKGTTVRQRRPKRVHVPKVCDRCHRRLPYRTLTASMAVLDDGHIKCTVCPDCMTLEELGAMAWMEATSEAGLNTDGRILLRTKQFPAE